jgi:hypothetical protein
LLWSWDGYLEPKNPVHDAALLTPPSTLQAFRVGYRPGLDSSALKLLEA